jgi:hypothetical protein
MYLSPEIILPAGYLIGDFIVKRALGGILYSHLAVQPHFVSGFIKEKTEKDPDALNRYDLIGFVGKIPSLTNVLMGIASSAHIYPRIYEFNRERYGKVRSAINTAVALTGRAWDEFAEHDVKRTINHQLHIWTNSQSIREAFLTSAASLLVDNAEWMLPLATYLQFPHGLTIGR